MSGRPFEALLLLIVLGGVPEPVAAAAAADSPGSKAAAVVVYADADWQRAFLLENGRLFAAPAQVVAALPGPRHRVEITDSRVRDLGAAELPDAPPLGSLPAAGLRWVSLDGVVRAVVPAQETRTFLRVAAAGLDVDVHVPVRPPHAGEGMPRPGARVRLRGVLEPAADAWSRPRLWVADWGEAVVTTPAAPWEGVREVTIPAARTLARAGSSENEVRLDGRVVARRSARSFTIEKDGETIAADLDRADLVREGAPVEVRGFPATRRGDPVLADARWRTTGVADTQVSRREAGLRVITRAAEIRALPRAEAERGYPVRLEATVTYASDANGHVFVQDDTAGVYVHFTRWPVAAVSGERIRLEGFTAPGGLAPMVVDPVVTHLGRVALPPPLPVAPARLAAGFDDCRRVVTSGYVRRIRRGERETEMILGVEGLRVPVHLPLEVDDATLPPLDARVRIAAVCGTAFNWRSLFDHVELYAVGAATSSSRRRPAIRSRCRSPPSATCCAPRRATAGTGSCARTASCSTTATGSRSTCARRRARSWPRRAAPSRSCRETRWTWWVSPRRAGARLASRTPRSGASRPARRPSRWRAAAASSTYARSEADLARLRATLMEVVRQESGTTLVLQAADGVVEAQGTGDLDPVAAGRQHARGHGHPPRARPGRRQRARAAARPAQPGRRPARRPAALAHAGPRGACRRVSRRRGSPRARLGRDPPPARDGAHGRADQGGGALPAARRQRVRRHRDHRRRSAPHLREPVGHPRQRLHHGGGARDAARACRSPPSRGRTSARRWSAPESGPTTSPVELGIEMVRKDGTHRFMHVRARAMRDASGRLTGFCAAARDVTARRQAERELARLATAIAQSADAIVLTDPKGTILYVNPAFERVTGYAGSEVLGGNPSVLKSGAHDRAFYEAMWATLHAGDTWEGRFTNRRKDGRLFLEDASISPVRDGDGGLIGYVAVKRDVTRQVQLEGQLAQAPEDGGDRPPRRRHRPRLQQRARDHPQPRPTSPSSAATRTSARRSASTASARRRCAPAGSRGRSSRSAGSRPRPCSRSTRARS